MRNMTIWGGWGILTYRNKNTNYHNLSNTTPCLTKDIANDSWLPTEPIYRPLERQTLVAKNMMMGEQPWYSYNILATYK